MKEIRLLLVASCCKDACSWYNVDSEVYKYADNAMKDGRPLEGSSVFGPS